MRTSNVFLGLAIGNALAHPGMDRLMAEIQTRENLKAETRVSSVVFGDLLEPVLTNTGDTIKSILQGKSAVADGSTYTSPGPVESDACKKDPLCPWSYLVQEMSAKFADANGCTDPARAVIRLGFHDAATWDTSSPYGGADGSLVLNAEELARADNRGLQNIAALVTEWYNKYHPYGCGMADIVQTGAIVATVSCPGGPRIRAFAGRIDDSTAGPPGELPSPFQDAQSLIDLFRAKTFEANDLVALIGAHTASKQFFVDPGRAGTPQDSSPQIWDNGYYTETLNSDNRTILTFPSDKSLATYSATKGQWLAFAGAPGRASWGPAYAQAYFRMSMLGVKNMNDLTEITRVIPLPRR